MNRACHITATGDGVIIQDIATGLAFSGHGKTAAVSDRSFNLKIIIIPIGAPQGTRTVYK